MAIFDDLGAIVVIASFYTAHLSLTALAVAAVLIVVLVFFNRFGVRRPAPFLLVGTLLWVAVLKSGVHATLAGVVVAMVIPLRASGQPAPPQPLESPLRHLEHALHPWVALGVLPLFAFANAGVSVAGLSLKDTLHPVPLGIVAGLFLGKQIGIVALSWLATRLRLASLPEGVGWWQLHGTALLCGIGFTMSLFIASLAFEQGGATGYLRLERLGILIGTLASGLCGYLVLRASLDHRAEPT